MASATTVNSVGVFLPLLLVTLSSAVDDDRGVAVNGAFPEILKDEAVSRLNELGKISDSDSYLERTFLSPASIRAGKVLSQWMEDAGLTTWVDQMGNIHGRVGGIHHNSPALLIGSHLDTVVDAGKFDGALGIVSAIAALKALKLDDRIRKLKRPIEVIAFSDEEGVRFQSTFLGSAAIAGKLPTSILNVTDKRFPVIPFLLVLYASYFIRKNKIHMPLVSRGKTLLGVLQDNDIDASDKNLISLKYNPESVWGYIEIHIEQGPVLEAVGFPLGVVEGIAGQTRLKVTVTGSQGHAGTVPMSMRRDPMAAAAELIVQLESLCKQPEVFLPYQEGQCNLSGSLVCTVGEISSWPSASNVIPGKVSFTIDLRTMDDTGRQAVLYELSIRMYHICERRSVACQIEQKHSADAVACNNELSLQLQSAALSAFKRMAGNVEVKVPKLMSGAGHDAMAMAHLTKVGMLFVRCRGGVSHSPQEHVLDDDVWAAGLSLLSFLELYNM